MKNGLKNAKRDQKTMIRNATENFLAPLRPPKNFSPPIFHQILKVFHRPKFAHKKKVVFHREALEGWPRQIFTLQSLFFLELISAMLAGVLRGNTIRGNATRNSERKMALWEGLWEGLWKTSENL